MQKLTKDLEKVEVCPYEIDQGAPTPTVKTLQYLEEKYSPKRSYIIIGADNLAGLPMWDEIEILEKSAEFVIITRDNITIDARYKQLQLDIDASSTSFREELDLAKIPKSIREDVRKFYKIKKGEDLREDVLKKIEKVLDDKKGENIEIFNLKERDYIVDYVVIATALADKHALSLLDALKSELKPDGEQFLQVDDENPDWIVADLGDIMIHIFTENQRKKFNLEEFLQKIVANEKESRGGSLE